MICLLFAKATWKLSDLLCIFNKDRQNWMTNDDQLYLFHVMFCYVLHEIMFCNIRVSACAHTRVSWVAYTG